MLSQPCRLLFLAVLLAVGFFSSASAQDTVPKDSFVTQYNCRVDGGQIGSGLVSSVNECAEYYAGRSWSKRSPTFLSWYNEPVGARFEFEHCGYAQSYCETGDSQYWGWTVEYNVSLSNAQQVPECPASHPIDNGDGTCSIDTSHEDWCQAVANGEWGEGSASHGYGGTEYNLDSSHPLYGSVSLCVTYDHSVWVGDGTFNDDGGAGSGYSCVYELDFHSETAGETWYQATNEPCTRLDDGNCPEGRRNCASTHVPGSDDGGGPGDGGVGDEPINGPDLTPPNNPTEPSAPDPASSPEAENLTYLGEKFAFETRKQTDQIVEGMAQAVNNLNQNDDENTQKIVKGLAAIEKGISEIPGGGGGGTGNGDPAGWGNEEDVSIDALDCLPDPVTGRCTNWAPLTEQELPEKIINLDDEIAQFDEYSVTASCPDSLDMGLSFGVFDYNSKPVCDTLGGVRYILLALAYFLVARIVMRSM